MITARRGWNRFLSTETSLRLRKTLSFGAKLESSRDVTERPCISMNSVMFGPYSLETRKDLLKRLLNVQKGRGSWTKCRRHAHQQRRIRDDPEPWRLEEQDRRGLDPTIYREVIGQDLEWISYEIPAFSVEEKLTLEAICSEALCSGCDCSEALGS